MEENKNNVFETLSRINVNEHTEKRSGLTYLSWSWAWAEINKHFNCSYEVVKHDGKPYLYDEHLGYMIFTNVTIEGETKEMWLPVMDGANKAMKAEPYEYTTKYGKKRVEAATMFDINKTMMRCLVKNLAMFGLGLYIYSGEDLPEKPEPVQQIGTAKPQTETIKLADFTITEEEDKALEEDLKDSLDFDTGYAIDTFSVLNAKGKSLGIDILNNEKQNAWMAKRLKLDTVDESITNSLPTLKKYNDELQALIKAKEAAK